jgi:hypothetical protein
MKSININVLQAVSTLVAAGEISIQQLRDAIAEKRGLNMPCGASRDEHGHFYSFFVATEKDDRTKARRSEDGDRIKFNLRPNGVKKDQKAQTPGEVLPQSTAGAPAVSQETLQKIAELLKSQEALATAKAPEDDFGDVQAAVETL